MSLHLDNSLARSDLGLEFIDRAILKFEDVCLKERGSIISGPFGSNIGKKFFVEEGIPVIRGNNISEKFELFKDYGFVFVSESKAQELGTWAIEDDLIFTAAGTLGQVGIIPKIRRFDRYIISNKQIRARIDKTKILPLFAFIWFKTGRMIEYIKSRNTGSTIPLINLRVIRSLPIPAPPLPEQNQIVKIVMSLYNKIELNEKMNKTLEAIAQAIFKHWFIDFEFPDENGKPYKSSGGEMVDSELGKIPKGWMVSNIGRELTTVLGGTPSTNKKDYWNGGNIPWINSGKINEFRIIKPSAYITPEALTNSATKMMPKGTTVLAITGATLGNE